MMLLRNFGELSERSGFGGRKDHAASILSDFDVTLTEALEFTAAFTPEAFPQLTQHLDPALIEEALLATGTATIRRRRLPADRVVWLVLAMALLRDWPIAEVARRLELALPAPDGNLTVASSALTQARTRLGAKPMEWLFLRTGEAWAGAAPTATGGRILRCTPSTGRPCELLTASRTGSTSAAIAPAVTTVGATNGSVDIRLPASSS